MKLRRGIVLGVGLLAIVSLMLAPYVRALGVTPTVFLSDSPLLVTAYQRTNDGLQFVQLYNAGDTPLKLTDWNITNESGQAVVMTNVHGWLVPKSHVIASVAGVVTGASAQISPLTFGASAKLSVIPPAQSGYKQVDYDLKAAGTTVWRRSTTTTGYSSSTTSFSATTDQNLFDDGWYEPPTDPVVRIVEIYPYASECAPHDASVLCGDYVKLYNPTASDVSLDNYVLRTNSGSANRTSSNTFSLDGEVIPAGGFHTVWLSDNGSRMSLTNSGGYVWLEDTWGITPYLPEVSYASAGSSQQGYAWAQDTNGGWEWTSAPQPLSANVFPLVLATETSMNILAACPTGQYRNPDTNRCKSIVATTSATLTPCKEGQERNPATNRCRSIASAVAELIPCDEGYERNPATNRCRKVIADTANPLANAAAAQAAVANNSALPWVLGVAAAGALGYGVFEWRHEIGGALGKLAGRFKK